MLKNLFVLIICTTATAHIHAQHFISKAVIEYEMKADIKKTMGSGMFEDAMKDALPQFKKGYFTLTFFNNKSIYKFDHWAEEKVPEWLRTSDENSTWFYDYNNETYSKQKNIAGSNFNIEDTITKLKWKVTTESRMIAGFNCRKAVAVIFDSVYVFAFYTDEILLTGGPASINGLPGAILGVTIPRLYTSWIATKVMVNDANESIIKPVAAKKMYTNKSFAALINDKTKDWFNYGDDDNSDERKQQKARFLWQLFL